MRAKTFLRSGIATCLAASMGMLTVVQTPGYAAALAATLNTVTGPSGGGNPILATVAAPGSLAFPAGTQPTIQFQYVGAGANACSASAQSVTQIDGNASAVTAGVITVDPNLVRRLSTTKVVFTVPSVPYPGNIGGVPSTVNAGGLVLLTGQATSAWNVCFYDSASTTASTLIAATIYTLAVRPTITAILPPNSPAVGGQSITVNGVGFTSGTTAAIDGAPLTDLVLAANGNSFTATTPAHVAGSGYALTVKSLGGTVTSANPDNNDQTADAPMLFTFDNGIWVAPNTAPAGSVVTLDVQGAGFGRLTFDPSAAPTDPTAHVFLVRDGYDPAANRGVQECTNVLLVGDSELICSLDLSADRLNPADSSVVNGTPVAEGAYIVTVVADGSTGAPNDATNASILSSGATFTVARY